jgi:hypothetical protein
MMIIRIHLWLFRWVTAHVVLLSVLSVDYARTTHPEQNFFVSQYFFVCGDVKKLLL